MIKRLKFANKTGRVDCCVMIFSNVILLVWSFTIYISGYRHHFNSLDKTNIKSHNTDVLCIYNNRAHSKYSWHFKSFLMHIVSFITCCNILNIQVQKDNGFSYTSSVLWLQSLFLTEKHFQQHMCISNFSVQSLFLRTT